MHWDGTISLGAVVNLVVLVGGLFALYNRIAIRLERLETQVQPMWDIFARHPNSRTRQGDEDQ